MIKEEAKKLQARDFVVNEHGEQKRIRRRSRKTIGDEGSRKQTAIVLFLTIIFSLIFYLPAEVKEWWQRFNKDEVIVIEKPVGDAEDVSEIVGFKVVIKKREDAQTTIEKLLDELNGNYGVWVEKIDSKAGFGINEETVMAAASVIKLPILTAYYQKVDKGTISPETIYVLKEEDRFEYGSGSMQNQPEGTEYSYQEITKLASNQSDNMAAKLLTRFLGGGSKVDEIIKEWKVKETSTKDNETTAKEIGELFLRLYKGELLKKESRDELFNNLTNTVLEDRLPAGVPTGVRVVHKFGSEEGVVSDCGIVYANDPYVICVLSNTVNDGEAEEVLPKISRVVREWAGK